MSRNARAYTAFAIAWAILAALAGLLLTYTVMGDAAAHPAASPAAAANDAADDGFPEVDWDYWLSVNGDIVGWISIPGTEVSYPIVQAQPSDPSHYLTHDVYGNVNVYGAVYLDAGCADAGLDSDNAVIFGHHMNDGSMLAAVADYSDEGFMRECGTVQLQTPSRKWTVEVRAAEVCPGWSATKRTAFSDKQDFRAYWEERMAASLVTRDVDTASPPWKMTTLVTCSYRFTPSDERTLAYCW